MFRGKHIFSWIAILNACCELKDNKITPKNDMIW